ncbi:unnamed protein product [Heligmosomoides polygyrus]|uniref:DUF1758 domain-containing protein n=1 Tax=Heligmosomoides polygyrus TaxID=6339 RepID=A0A183FB71_HELPZ|nr:unnamed protein product [Heligmosomoides polygyrus]
MGVRLKAHSKKPPTKGTADVDILIGMDYYWSVLDLNHNRKLPSGLVQSQTKLGPVLSGPNTAVTQVTTDPIRQHESERETDDIVRKLFALDSAELDDDRDTVNTEIIQQYYDTVKAIKGMIHVQFPWEPNHPFLPDNKPLALHRLESQYRKLHANPKLWSEYCRAFDQQLEAGIIEEVTKDLPSGTPVYSASGCRQGRQQHYEGTHRVGRFEPHERFPQSQ